MAVTGRSLALFALVAFLWGIPYLLIAVALTGFDSTTVVWGRVALAAIVLVIVVGPRALAGSLRGRLLAIGGFAVVQFVVPLSLIAEAERSVPSSLVGCLVASEPVWIALFASRVDRAQRTGFSGAIGLVVGLVGVGVLLGVEPAGGVGGAALVLAATCCYALAALLVVRLAAVPRLHLIAASLVISAIILSPLVIVAPPSQVPGMDAVAALVGLAVVCTAIAFPLWFALIARVGAARAALVTYASPVVSIALGVVLLGEQPGRLAPLGLALVLAGSWAASRSGGAARAPAAPARPLCDAGGGVRLATHVSIHGSAPRS